MRCIVIALFLLSLLSSYKIDTSNATSNMYAKNIETAVQYLVSHFNPAIGLVWESEDSGIHWLKTNEMPNYKWSYQSTYWAYSDNLFAYLALEPFNSTISRKIADNIATIPNVGEFLTVNGTPTLSYRAVTNIVVASSPNYIILSRTYTGQNILPPLGFADERMYYSLSLYEFGKIVEARQQFQTALNLWNGTCFVDDSIMLPRNTNDGALTDHGFCANNRIGLALFVGKVLNIPVPYSLQTVLWSMQNSDGGIASLSLSGKPLGSANAETTALALLLCNDALIARLNKQTTSSRTSQMTPSTSIRENLPMTERVTAPQPLTYATILSLALIVVGVLLSRRWYR